MKVFLSWSGPRSRAIAKALHDSIRVVIQASEPWMSAEDIRRGKRWGLQLAESLGSTNFGVVCLTPENLDARWILFEAGALAKNLEEAFVCTYLLDLKPTDVETPLSDFQATIADHDGTLKLFQEINAALPEDRRIREPDLEYLFEQLWPNFEKNLHKARALAPIQSAPLERTDRDLLEEMLSTIRSLPPKAPAIVIADSPIQAEAPASVLPEKQKIFYLGSPVRHPTFGFGRVLEIYETGQITRLRVHFYAVGEKTLALHVTNLQPVAEPQVLTLADARVVTAVSASE